jgi:FixJ family two-component response regulator
MEIRDANVVVVDDDESVRGSLARLFKSAGFGFVSFASAEEFLDSPQRATARCLIIDVHLPGISGLQLQKMCKAQRPDLAIIVISAFSDAAVEQAALNADAIAFLRKPFDCASLLALVKTEIQS